MLDRLIGLFSPAAALKRLAARQAIARYDAGTPSRLREYHTNTASGDSLIGQYAKNIYTQARHLERNNDLARSVLNTLTTNTAFISIEPQPRKKDGSIDSKMAQTLQKMWLEWCQAPECSGMHTFEECERLLANSLYRDGEVYVNILEGDVPKYQHKNPRGIKLSLEMMEADCCPIEHSDGKSVWQGIKRNEFGGPISYFFYKGGHPGDAGAVGVHFMSDKSALKEVRAQNVLHLAIRRRLHQARGESVLSPIITTIQDMDDAITSERIAAKMSAMLGAYISRGGPDQYDPSDDTQREISLAPGVVIENLMPGEKLEVFNSNRPNPNMRDWREDLTRGVAGATETGYSEISRNFGGSYSSQRQELVTQRQAYERMQRYLIDNLHSKVYKRFVRMVVLQGLIKIPKNIDLESLDDCLMTGPAMPWINPTHEADAMIKLVGARLASPQEQIRKRGNISPDDVLAQHAAWEKMTIDKGLTPISINGNNASSVNADTAQQDKSNAQDEQKKDQQGDAQQDQEDTAK